jgi:hypothetical protein
VRQFDAFNVIGKGPADLRAVDALNWLELQIAVDATIDQDRANARYYMLVPKEVVPRGFATLNYDQFNRMCEAIACERLLNAPREASRGLYDIFIENMFETRNTDVVSANVSDSYLADLKSKARKSPFKHAELLNLAQGQSVTINGFEWSAQKFQDLADSALEARGLELMIRSSTGRYNPNVRGKWDEYVALLRKHGVALSPKQIQNLFSFWQGGGSNAEHLGK